MPVVNWSAMLATWLEVVRDLAEAVHEPADDLHSAIGPVVVFGKPEREPFELRQRIDTIARTVCSCIAMCTFANVALHELPRDAAREAHMDSVGRQGIAAIRLAARRLAELTSAAARRSIPDPAGDDRVLAALRTATERATVTLNEWNPLVLAANCAGTAHDMLFHYTRIDDPMFGPPVQEVHGRTHVSFGENEVTIVAFEVPRGKRIEVEDRNLWVHTTTLRREELRGAKLVASEGRVRFNDEIRSDCSVEITTQLLVAARDVTPHLIGWLGHRDIVIHCDTAAHRDELIAELQRFAEGEARAPRSAR